MKSAVVEKLEATKKALLSFCPELPRWAIVLGSGFGAIADEMDREKEIAYGEIPHFLAPTVQGHRGRLVVGRLGKTRVLCLQGRLHYYEGHAMEDVVFPTRALAYSGIENFVLTNAAGSLRPDWTPPSLVLLSDHINLMGTNPLLGKNCDELGPRFPDLTEVYDGKLRNDFLRAADRAKVALREGVYVGITGPCYETPSEVRMYRVLGGDLIGMSTIPEAIAARHMGKKVTGISCVTNLAAGAGEPVEHHSVLENVKEAHPRLRRLLEEVLS